jgi:ATP-binding cassette subfamily F protein uup
VQLGYYDQRSADLNDALRLLEFIEKEAPLIRTKEGERVEAAQMLEWFLFPRAMQQGRIGSLSGGERRRLYLLRTLIHQPNVLLLDEPTNDLDIQTLAVLEEFLDHFTGCLIVVSHDRYFLDRTVDFIMPFDEGRLGGKYPTPYETFVRLRAEEAAATSGEAAGKGGGGGKSNHELRSHEVFANQPPATQKIETIRMEGPRKLSWKEQKELELLTKRIEDLEKKKQKLVDKLGLVGNNYLQLQELADELAGVDQELDGAMLRWLELEEPG